VLLPELALVAKPAREQSPRRCDEKRMRTAARDLLDELSRQVRFLDFGRQELLVREYWRVRVQASAALAMVCIPPGPQRSGVGWAASASPEQSVVMPCPPAPLRQSNCCPYGSHPAERSSLLRLDGGSLKDKKTLDGSSSWSDGSGSRWQ
jgi:hypothetical protein